jgi:hypothetical protein
MAIVTNTFLSFSAIGNREDISDTIYNISPTDTPFQAAVGKTKAEATLHEWQTDVLTAAATNAQLQGDDTTSSYTFASVTPTVRLGNRTQISRKDVVVSGTQDAVNKAGRKKEMVYQLLKRSKELARDMEFALTQNQGLSSTASGAGDSTHAPQLRGVETWAGVTTTNNYSQGAGGAVSVSGAARTQGTQRALTESMLKSALQGAWSNGGDIDLIMVGPFNKTVVSTFTGNNTRTQDTSDKKLISAINVYVSDFGTHKVVANRFSQDRTLHALMTDMWAVATLRPKQTIDLAKLGDNEKAMIIAEYTLESRNDSGSAWVFDLTTS